MLDVHPPEHPAHSWSDFFIHMGTICLGLLIALSLEQAVEWSHMRHRVAETREALRKELEVNHKGFQANSATFRYNGAALRNDLTVLLSLRDHPKATAADLPGVIVLGAMHIPTAESAWNAAKQTGVVEHMPLEEVTNTDLMYTNLHTGDEMQSQYWECINHAGRFEMVDPDITHLSHEAVEEEIDQIEECADINRRMGVQLENLAGFRGDFTGGPTVKETQGIYVEPTPELAAQRAPAKARTDEALKTLREAQSKALEDAIQEFVASSKK